MNRFGASPLPTNTNAPLLPSPFKPGPGLPPSSSSAPSPIITSFPPGPSSVGLPAGSSPYLPPSAAPLIPQTPSSTVTPYIPSLGNKPQSHPPLPSTSSPFVPSSAPPVAGAAPTSTPPTDYSHTAKPATVPSFTPFIPNSFPPTSKPPPPTTPSHPPLPSTSALSHPPLPSTSAPFVPSSTPPVAGAAYTPSYPPTSPSKQPTFNPSVHKSAPPLGLPDIQGLSLGPTSTPAAPSVYDTSKARIDPAQAPAATALYNDQGRHSAYSTRTFHAPPPASSNFEVIDEGNANPHLIRLTSYNLPISNDVANQVKIPVGAILQPFSEQAQVPVVDMGPNGPIRCNRCQAYINPYFRFLDGGKSFRCNFCEVVNEVAPEYFSPMGPHGRADRESRPELHCGAVDFVATSKYFHKSRPPGPPSYVFALDVSSRALASGMVATFCTVLKNVLELLPEKAEICIMTYDTTIHFYQITAGKSQPQMLVMPDISSAFLPLDRVGLLVNYKTNKSLFQDLLTKIPAMFKAPGQGQSVFLPVVQAAHLALKNTGGKIIMFQSALPAVGPGALKLRVDPKLIGTVHEKTIYAPADPLYAEVGAKLVEDKVTVDLFLTPESYIDVSTLGTLPRLTSGQLYYYPSFHAGRDSQRVFADLRRNIDRNTAFETALRVRCSKGLSVSDFIGNFQPNVYTDEIDCSTIDADKSYIVRLKYEERLEEKSEAALQTAILYTTKAGERRIRVITTSVPVTNSVQTLFKTADFDTVFHIIIRSAMRIMVKEGLAKARTYIVEQLVEILAAFRENYNHQSPVTQLILPDALRHLPMLCLGILKSVLFKVGFDVSLEERCFLLDSLLSSPISVLPNFSYPRLYPLHQLLSATVPLPVDRSSLPLSALRLSLQSTDNPAGSYLIDDGFRLLLFICAQADAIFNHLPVVAKLDNHYPVSNVESIEGVSDEARTIHSFIVALRSANPYFQPLQFTRHGDALEPRFLSYFIEDKTQSPPLPGGQQGPNDSFSYLDFLLHLHKEIHNKVKHREAAVVAMEQSFLY